MPTMAWACAIAGLIGGLLLAAAVVPNGRRPEYAAARILLPLLLAAAAGWGVTWAMRGHGPQFGLMAQRFGFGVVVILSCLLLAAAFSGSTILAFKVYPDGLDDDRSPLPTGLGSALGGLVNVVAAVAMLFAGMEAVFGPKPEMPPAEQLAWLDGVIADYVRKDERGDKSCAISLALGKGSFSQRWCPIRLEDDPHLARGAAVSLAVHRGELRQSRQEDGLFFGVKAAGKTLLEPEDYRSRFGLLFDLEFVGAAVAAGLGASAASIPLEWLWSVVWYAAGALYPKGTARGGKRRKKR